MSSGLDKVKVRCLMPLCKNKQNIENVPLQELVGNNPENVDVKFIRNYGNNGYGNNNYNPYNKPPYVPHPLPLVPYPNTSDNK